MKYYSSVIAIITFLLLSGCASVPPILATPEDTPLSSYEDVVLNQAQVDSVARWGGVIAHVDNTATGSVIEMVHFPLKSSGRPNLSRASIGRFKVFVDGFIDPLVFKQERVLSVLGTVGEPVEGSVSEQVYVYPSLHATGYYLWEDVEEFDYNRIQVTPFFRFGHGIGLSHGFGFDLGFPYHRTRYHGLYNERGRVRIRSGNTQSGSVNSSASNPSNQDLPARNIPPPKSKINLEHNRKYSNK